MQELPKSAGPRRVAFFHESYGIIAATKDCQKPAFCLTQLK
jgi:hypothetical protein